MDFLLSDGRLSIRENDQVPAHLLKYAIAGAQCRYKLIEEGEILSQVLLGNDFSIWVHYFLIHTKVKIVPFSQVGILTLHYMISGNIDAHLEGYGNVQLKEGECQLFYVPGKIRQEAYLLPDHYCSVHINFHPTHLEPLTKQYPIFEPMLSTAEKEILLGKGLMSSFISPESGMLIKEIIRNTLPGVERNLFFESRIRDLLRLYVHDLSAGKTLSEVPDPHVKLLISLERYIDMNLDKKLSVERLARHFKVSRSWLQQLSRQHNDKGIHRMVIEKRMEEASRLLLTTTHAISTIVVMVSDMTFAAFTAAFHEYYGQPPLEYRKNRGQMP